MAELISWPLNGPFFKKLWFLRLSWRQYKWLSIHPTNSPTFFCRCIFQIKSTHFSVSSKLSEVRIPLDQSNGSSFIHHLFTALQFLHGCPQNIIKDINSKFLNALSLSLSLSPLRFLISIWFC